MVSSIGFALYTTVAESLHPPPCRSPAFLRIGPGHGTFRAIIQSSSRTGIRLFAKINHVAIVSEKYALLASFYESLFGMHRSAKGKINRAITVGDGYVGLNINPRKAGRPEVLPKSCAPRNSIWPQGSRPGICARSP